MMHGLKGLMRVGRGDISLNAWISLKYLGSCGIAPIKSA